MRLTSCYVLTVILANAFVCAAAAQSQTPTNDDIQRVIRVSPPDGAGTLDPIVGRITSCKPVGTQCVGVIAKDDRTLWLADRVSQDGRYTWVPIKKADCPSPREMRAFAHSASDPDYGSYECKADDAGQIGTQEEPVAATRGGGLRSGFRPT